MANCIDPRQEQRVWSRVMAAQAASAPEPDACERLSRRDAPVFDEDSALELYTAQLRAAATYRVLSSMARGCARQSLMRLAEEKRCEAKRLAAAYFVMTGTKPCPDRPRPPCVSCLNEALRQAYREERCAAELYRRYAERGGDHACLLENMAKRACESAQAVLCILQNTL